MTCRRASALIAAYLDGELSPAAGAGLEAHMACCPRCRQRVADSREALAALTALAAARPEDDAPAPDAVDLRVRIAAAAERAAVRRAWTVAAVTTALVGLGLTAALYLPRSRGRAVEVAIRGAQDRLVVIGPRQPMPDDDNDQIQVDRTPQRTPPRRALRRVPSSDRPTPARLACRGMTAALLAALFRGGESTVEHQPTVAVVVAWDDALPEEAWNVPETSSYSAAVTLANGDRNTLATETHHTDPDAPIMVAATYEPHL